MEMKQGSALTGLKVLDLGRVIAGPLACSVLADMGADVIKIEDPGTGDLARNMMPKKDGISTYFVMFNRGQRGITLDLKDAQGKAILRKLIQGADVLVENFRPGVMQRLGFSYDEVEKINPRIIYASISGFGQEGVYAQQALLDPVAQAISGLMSVTGPAGGEQVRCGASICDILAAQNAVIAILAAIEHRRLTGHGQHIDVSLVDSAIFALASINQIYFTTGAVPQNLGNFFEASAPGNTYPTRDGQTLMISAGQASMWPKFAAALGHSEWIDRPEFKQVENRVKNRKILDELVCQATAQFTRDELLEKMIDAKIPAGPVLTVADVANDPHFRDTRNMYSDVLHPQLGPVRITNQAIHMSETTPYVRGCSPQLGQHNEEVYVEYGFTPEEISNFRACGVI